MKKKANKLLAEKILEREEMIRNYRPTYGQSQRSAINIEIIDAEINLLEQLLKD